MRSSHQLRKGSMRRPSVHRVAVVLAPAVMLCAAAGGCNNLLGIASWRDVPGDASAAEAGPAGRGEAGEAAACNAEQGDAGDWCQANAPGVSLCDDFDHGDAFSTGWSYQAPHGGDGIIDSLDPYSPPSSFFASTPALDGGFAQWFLSKALPTKTYTHVVFSFDVRVEPLASNDPGEAVLAVILLGGAMFENASGYSVSIVETATGVLLSEHLAVGDSGPDPETTLATTPPTSWTRFRLDITLNAPAQTGGELTISQTTLPPFPSGSQPCSPTITKHTITSSAAFGPPQFNLGQVFVGGPSTTMLAHFDDVIIDVQ